MNSPLKIAGCLLLSIALFVSVSAQTGTQPRSVCQSTCSGDLGENIFPDGDFGQGIPNVVATDPGIAPGYNYIQNPPPNDGSYTITNSTASWGSFAANTWIKIEDNGPEPYGYMMVVNASYQPGLFYQKKVPVCENTLYEMSLDVIAMNMTKYMWQPSQGLSCISCPMPVAMPLQTAIYMIHATDERGCSGVDSVRITVLPSLEVYAPNVFRQNIADNGINNAFTLFPSKSATRIRHLEIYDRWGELVFRRENETPGSEMLRWNGTDFRGHTLDEGVYTWWAEIEFFDGKVQIYMGDVTLLNW